MRRDMAKVIVERPRFYESYSRSNPSYEKNKILQYDEDAFNKNEGMRKPHVYKHGGKGLNENLAPLRRFLRSQVGRLWDDVYSEISKCINVNSATQAHIREHIFQYVEKDVYIKDGIPYHSAWGKDVPLAKETYGKLREQIYVHPETGILCLAKDRKIKRIEAKYPIQINESEYYDIINGLWFWVKTEWFLVEAGKVYDSKYERVKLSFIEKEKFRIRYGFISEYDFKQKYKCLIEKRQLSKKEIKAIKKKYGLV